MSNLGQVLKAEIQKIAKREARSEVAQARKLAAEHRRAIAQLKRENRSLQARVGFLEGREKKRIASGPKSVPQGTRFSVRSLRAQRKKTGLSQADYAHLLGVSTMTMSNWELGKTRPQEAHLAKIVALRGLGKRQAERRLELLEE